MVGKYILEAHTSAAVQSVCGVGVKERERDGGHGVDKAVLFLIYVLL